MSFTREEMIQWGMIPADVTEEKVDEVKEEVVVEETIEEVKEEIKEEVKEETKTEIVAEEVKETVEPEIELEFSDDTSKEFYDSIGNGDYDKAYEILNSVMEYKKLSGDDLLAKYLKELNPQLDEDEILFQMAENFGVGLQPLSDEQRELMSEKEIGDYEKLLKKQGIEKKKVIAEAKKHYEELTKDFKIELPKTKVNIKQPEVPVDEHYEAYKESVTQAEAASKQWKETLDAGFKDFSDEIGIPLEFELNDGKVAFESRYKLTEKEKKAVYDELLTRVASPTEQAQFIQDGKVNLEGYMSHVAKTMYMDKIINTAAKEAASSILEGFIEKEIKNSTVSSNGQANPVVRGRTAEQELMSKALSY